MLTYNTRPLGFHCAARVISSRSFLARVPSKPRGATRIFSRRGDKSSKNSVNNFINFHGYRARGRRVFVPTETDARELPRANFARNAKFTLLRVIHSGAFITLQFKYMYIQVYVYNTHSSLNIINDYCFGRITRGFR